MGYESRVYIVEEHNNTLFGNYAEVLVTVEMGVIPDFRNIFETPINYEIYIGNYKIYTDNDENTSTDWYGDPIKSADVETVMNWLENALSGKDGEYRRLRPLYYLLKAYKEEEKKWDKIKVLHYGH